MAILLDDCQVLDQLQLGQTPKLLGRISGLAMI